MQNEVDLLTKIQHPNIISLLGYSSHEESKFLVYELMQNGSLETQLHGKSTRIFPLVKKTKTRRILMFSFSVI